MLFYLQRMQWNKKSITTEDLVEMAGFGLKKNFLELNSKIKQKVSGTAIGTKFAPTTAQKMKFSIKDFFIKCLRKYFLWSGHMCVFSRTNLRQVFLKRSSCNPSFGVDILVIFSLYGHTVKKKLTLFWKALLNLICVLSSPTTPMKKVSILLT